MKSVYFLIFGFLAVAPALAKTVRYELTLTQERVNLSGKKEVGFALLVNGGIPAPVLEFTEGDIAEITVKNRVPDQEASIHWHGILLPPEMDGVPYVNTPPIYPGEEFTFRFPIRQHGTYWYHSHTDVQEQKGVYGALVIHPKKPKIKADHDVVAVLSDWSDEDALKILANLRKDGEYYVHKKDTMRSYWGALREGKLFNYLYNEWTGMGGMDYSDVGYDAFLINGKKDHQLVSARKGEKVRIRIINAGASSYFHIALADEAMSVVSADGVDTEPVFAHEILIGMAETYDVLFELPEDKNYELKITAQDGTGTASAWIGRGEKQDQKVAAPVKPLPPMYEKMDHGAHGGHGDHAGHSGRHQMGDVSMVHSLTVDEVQAPSSTVLPKDAKVHDLKLVLGGDMERYVWHIDGKAIHQDRNIEVREGEVVRFTFVNETMMHHPMHLHGHFFRVLNRFGDRSPLKHTVDVPPHSERTIEFYTDEPGEWMLHCHNLYHMKTGMARVVKYMSYQPKKEILPFQKLDPHDHDHWYWTGRLEASTNLAEGGFRLSQTWNEIDLRIESRDDEDWEVEGDLFYRRWFGQRLNLILGGTRFEEEEFGMAGAGLILPFLLEVQALVDHDGHWRLDLERRFQWTKYIHSDLELNWRRSHKTELKGTLMYSSAWAWAAGVTVTDESVGIGGVFRF